MADKTETVTMEQALTEIINGTLSASDRDKSFADSLLNGKYGLKKRGYLTDNQNKAAIDMYDRLQNPQPEDHTENLSKVYSFIMGARKFLKYPKIMLRIAEQPLKLYLSGVRSKYPDTINIVYGDDHWYGRVFESGEWHHPRQVDEGIMSQIRALLIRLAEDPAAVAMDHGHMTGNCCFCNRKLTDDRSVAVGFGPVCADRWGLKAFWSRAAKDTRMPVAAHVAHQIKTGKKLNTQNEDMATVTGRRVRVKRSV